MAGMSSKDSCGEIASISSSSPSRSKSQSDSVSEDQSEESKDVSMREEFSSSPENVDVETTPPLSPSPVPAAALGDVSLPSVVGEPDGKPGVVKSEGVQISSCSPLTIASPRPSSELACACVRGKLSAAGRTPTSCRMRGGVSGDGVDSKEGSSVDPGESTGDNGTGKGEGAGGRAITSRSTLARMDWMP